MADSGQRARPAGPSLPRVFVLVLGLRFRLFLRRLGGTGRLGALVGGVLAAALSLGLGLLCYRLFGVWLCGVPHYTLWNAFAFSLFAFLISLFWVIWPLLAARVEEAYEMQRFALLPVRPLGLYAIQTAVGLFEPATLFFCPAVVGAVAALPHGAEYNPLWAAAAVIAFVLMNAAAGRCLLNLFLNLARSRRSAELLLLGLIALLGLAALLPPVDASWLLGRLGDFGGDFEDLELLRRTTRSLINTPPGQLVLAVAEANDELRAGLYPISAMLFTALLFWVVGLGALLRFYRGGRVLLRPQRRRQKPDAGHGAGARSSAVMRAPILDGPTRAVLGKELRTLLSNPKVRLLVAVPFFLLVILKIVGAAQLFAYLWGEAWAAIVLSLLGLYVLSVLGGQIFANSFAYDGQAVRWVFWSPAPTRAWLVGRNLAQAVIAIVQMLGLALLLLALLPGARATGLWLPACAFPFGLLVLLALGNLLSLRHPRRFHFSLARRDRPAAASVLGVLAGLGACATITLLALALAARAPSWRPAILAALPLLGLASYLLLLPLALRRLRSARERLIAAITR